MKNSKNGFNLPEMLIALALIAIIVAMIIPAVLSKKPNKNKALFRKAYYNIERIVYELVNDENMFPEREVGEEKWCENINTGEIIPLDSCGSSDDYRMYTKGSTLFAYYNSKEMYKNTTAARSSRDKSSTSKYLCSKIVERMNTTGNFSCQTNSVLPADGTVAGKHNFATNDGVVWFFNAERKICAPGTRYGTKDCAHPTTTDGDLKIPHDDFSDYVCFQIDVNGAAAPNSRSGDDPDRFAICITYDGNVMVPKTGGKEVEYLKSSKFAD